MGRAFGGSGVSSDQPTGGGSGRPDELRKLAREWGFVATEQVKLAKALQARAAEERQRAEWFESQGLLAQASEAREREAAWLVEAEDNLRKVQAALKAEEQFEGEEDVNVYAAELEIRLRMPDLLSACWSLAHAVRASLELDTVVREDLLRRYEALMPDLASLRGGRSISALLNQVRGYVRSTRALDAQEVARAWEHYQDVLAVFL